MIIASKTENRVRTWSFGKAPPEFQALFPESRDRDWVVHVPAAVRHVVEPFLMRRAAHLPVKSKELVGRSVVYCGNRPQGNER